MRKLLLITTCLLILFNSTFVVTAEDPYVPSIGYKTDVYVTDDDEMGGTVEQINHTSVIHRIERGEGDAYCEQKIVVTPYAFKDSIESDQSKIDIIKCYNNVINTKSVGTLAPVVLEYIEEKKLDLDDEDLVFSNIFDITVYFDEHGLHDIDYDHSRVYKVKVAANVLKNFVCLLHYDHNTNSYEIVRDCEIIDEETLKFSFPSSSPFVIVSHVDDAGSHTEDPDVPCTNGHRCIVDIGGRCYCLELLILLIISLFLNIYLILKNRKKKKEDEDEKQ